jgi:hypothetical protein
MSRLRTRRRPPEVSSTAFPAHLPDVHPRPLMDEDFAVTCPLVRPGLPQIRFLFVRSRFCSTLLSDAASRRRPCASLALHLHQVVQGTCTPKLSNMLGTQVSRSRGRRIAGFSSQPATPCGSLTFAAPARPCPGVGPFPRLRPELVAEPLTNPSALTSMTGMHSPPKPVTIADLSVCRRGHRTTVPHRTIAPE